MREQEEREREYGERGCDRAMACWGREGQAVRGRTSQQHGGGVMVATRLQRARTRARVCGAAVYGMIGGVVGPACERHDVVEGPLGGRQCRRKPRPA